jgi:hypothetical protein
MIRWIYFNYWPAHKHCNLPKQVPSMAGLLPAPLPDVKAIKYPSYLNTKRMRIKAEINGLGAKSLMKLCHAELMGMQAAYRGAL